MKIVYPGINSVIEIKNNTFNSLVIENPSLLYDFISDIKRQTKKFDGRAVFSFNDEVLEISEKVILLTDAYDININSKDTINKLIDLLSTKALSQECFEQSMQLITDINNYLSDLTWDFECDLQFDEIVPKQILKMAGVHFVDDTDNLEEKLLKYFDVIRLLLGEKLFILLNFRSFIENDRFEKLIMTLIDHGFYVLTIENKVFPLISGENRLTIDSSLCEF